MLWRWTSRIHRDLHLVQRLDFWSVPHTSTSDQGANVTYTSPAVHYLGEQDAV